MATQMTKVTASRAPSAAELQDRKNKPIEQPRLERRGGRAYVDFPDSVSLTDIGNEFLRMGESAKKMVAVNYEFPGIPVAGGVAVWRTLMNHFGFVHLVDTPGFFGDDPPQLIDIQIGFDPKDSMRVPLGRFALPGLSGYIDTSIHGGANPRFVVTAAVRADQVEQFNQVMDAAKDELATNNVFQGRAWTLNMGYTDPNVKYDHKQHAPRFTIPLHTINPDDLILSDAVMRKLRAKVIIPLKRTRQVAEAKSPLKHGTLLHGKYGVGKSMIAWVVAKIATENGWTFINLENVRHLGAALALAKQIGNTVVFSEDIDRYVGQDENSPEVQALTLAMDGIDTKSMNVSYILTTNHLDRVPPVIRRPGRCDLVLEVKEPDAKAAAQIARRYAGDLLHPDTDMAAVGELLSGFIPAAIRGVIESAKCYAIDRMDQRGDFDDGKLYTLDAIVTEEDIREVVEQTDEHRKLSEQKKSDHRSELEKAFAAMGDAAGARMARGVAAGVERGNAFTVSMLKQLGVDIGALHEAVCPNGDGWIEGGPNTADALKATMAAAMNGK